MTDYGISHGLAEGSFARPADTTAYTDGDAVTDSTTAPSAVSLKRVGRGAGEVASVALISSANASADFEVWLFDDNVTATNDNSACAISDADLGKLVGVVPFTASSDRFISNAGAAAAGNSTYFRQGLKMPFRGRLLRALVVVRGAYTPVSGETFTVRLGIKE